MRLRQSATRKLRAWTARRFGVDTLPHQINRRRIYILPSRHGLALAALIIAMLIGALNYNSNLGLAFAFLMVGVALVAMHHCHRNLLGLVVDVDPEADGFEGSQVHLNFAFYNPSALDRFDIEIHCADLGTAARSIRAGSRAQLGVDVPAVRRGVLRLSQFELRTRYPFGWFRAWTYVQAPLLAYIYPRPMGDHRLPASAAAQGTATSAEQRGEEEFAGLRTYSPGIPLKHMAWKVLARGGEAAVRHYAGDVMEPEWLDWDALDGIAPEARLSQLCAWVVDAEAEQRRYGMRLPQLELRPARGAAHRSACLRALATYPAGPD
jgi:uncharacterized protein (DUF58 family)